MPWMYGIYAFRRFCERPFKWSQMRGGCRLEPRHAGPCKPGRYRR